LIIYIGSLSQHTIPIGQEVFVFEERRITKHYPLPKENMHILSQYILFITKDTNNIAVTVLRINKQELFT